MNSLMSNLWYKEMKDNTDQELLYNLKFSTSNTYIFLAPYSTIINSDWPLPNNQIHLFIGSEPHINGTALRNYKYYIIIIIWYDSSVGQVSNAWCNDCHLNQSSQLNYEPNNCTG